jgi:hypothetical protein
MYNINIDTPVCDKGVSQYENLSQVLASLTLKFFFIFFRKTPLFITPINKNTPPLQILLKLF